MATYLVTGGAGFIGSHLAAALCSQGHTVRVVDNLSTGKQQNIDPIKSQIEWIHGDITDATTAHDVVRGVDYILHQAALPSVPRSLQDPLASDFHNVHGTLQLLWAAKEHGVKRIVQACSSSAYGNTPTLPKHEQMRPQPRSPYAVSKVAGELYGVAFFHSYGVPYVGLRYFNVFGPRQDPKSQYAAVIPRFVTAALRKERPTIYGDGTQSRDFTFIDNVVQANLAACVAPEAVGHVMNIACGARLSLLDVIAEISKLVGHPVDPVFEPNRTGDVQHSLADLTLAKQLLNYQPQVSFSQGLARTIEWFRSCAQ